MKFKKSALALGIASTLLAGTTVVEAKTELKASYGQQQVETKLVTLHFDGAPAADRLISGEVKNYKADLNAITAKQNAFFKKVLEIDPTAKVVARSGLLANYISVAVANDRAEDVAKMAGVKLSNVSNRKIDHIPRSSITKNTQSTNTFVANEVELMKPFMESETAGEGVTVGIVSSGIDYTLEFFGGSGVYGEDNDPETPPPAGSYLEALENGPIAFGGFPTDVVTGGYDFASENFGGDANPIDQNYDYVHWNGAVYPTGDGTQIASIVRQLAPGANLHAYKIMNISPSSWDPDTLSVQWPTQDKVISSLEHAMDPNQDGDISDHVDVMVLDSWGSSAFYDEHLQGGSPASLIQSMVARASAAGVSVVTHAGWGGQYAIHGEAEAKYRAWLGNEGSPTGTIVTGSLVSTEDGSGLKVADWQPLGPVRGSGALKPEVTTMAEDLPVVNISRADDTAVKTQLRTGGLAGAARMAAAVAVIKSKHPNLGPAEIKALLANTASLETIMNSTETREAEIIARGHGIEDVDSATSSPVFVVNKDDYQPYVQFGLHQVMAEKVVNATLMIRNISDAAQTYEMSYNFAGTKPTHDALMVNHPATVTVPANRTVEIPVSITIDGATLPAWGLNKTNDYTDSNLNQHEINGFFNLTSEGNPDLALGFMIQARHKTTINKNPEADEFPIYKGWNPDLGETEWGSVKMGDDHYGMNDWGQHAYRGYGASFTNESSVPVTFEAYKLLIDKPYIADDKKHGGGHKIRAVGGGMFIDDAMCTSGKKFSLAVNFHESIDVANAEYWEKIGGALFFYDLFAEKIVLENGWDKSFAGAMGVWIDPADEINQPFVQLNDAGQPATYYIDKNKEYDWSQPNARYTESKLPTKFSTDGKTVISQLCVEELYHRDWDSVEDFDQNLGFHIETDRDSGRDKFEPIVMFNPLRGGYYGEEEVCMVDWFGNEICETLVNDHSAIAGFANIGEITTEGEQTYKEARADARAAADYTQSYTAQPGEEVTIVALQSSWTHNPTSDILVVSTDGTFMNTSPVGALKEGTVIVDVAAEQEFSVNENAAAGTVVGVVDTDHPGFFGFGGNDWNPHTIHIMNTVAGTPFVVDQETLEIRVQNPEALDFEVMKEYTLTMVSRQGNTTGTPQDVKVHIKNVNDIAPMVDADAHAAVEPVSVSFDEGSSASFTIDFAGVFADEEGDALTYTVTGDGLSDLSVDGTTVSGTATSGGDFTSTVTASDGSHEVSADFSVNAVEIAKPEETKKKSSSGSFGGMLALMLSLVALRRRS